MIKINILLLLPLVLLVSCIMPVVGGMGDPDILNDYKVIQAWQQHNAVGHTDVEQRKKDVFACGVKNLMGGGLDLAVRYPGMNTERVITRMQRISNCMKSKRICLYRKRKMHKKWS